MNRDEAIKCIESGLPVKHDSFCENEFLIGRDDNIYDEGGYLWKISNVNNINFEGWSLWLDLNNLKERFDQPRNMTCKCGSGKKFKKCCYLTQDEALFRQGIKLEYLNRLYRAIDENLSYTQYVNSSERETKALMKYIKSLSNSDLYL